MLAHSMGGPDGDPAQYSRYSDQCRLLRRRDALALSQLSGGVALIPALVGAFGFAEVLTTLADPVERRIVEMSDSVLPRFREVIQ
jgi:TctA family transporter